MKKQFLTIFSVLLTSFFFTNVCFAYLEAPQNPEVISVGQGSAVIHWDHTTNPGDDLERFKVFYKIATSTVTEWNVKYPTVDNSISSTSSDGITTSTYEYGLIGLNAGEDYIWGIIAEAADSANDSNFTNGEAFTTEQSQWEEENPEEEGGEEGSAPIDLSSPFENIGNLSEAADEFMNFLTTSAFAIAPILIIYAGFLLLTKQDSPESLKRAKNIILWSVIALSIILFAKGVPSVIEGLFK
jgi:hypothetical protein